MRHSTKLLSLAGIAGIAAVTALVERKLRSLNQRTRTAATVGTSPHVARDGTITDAEIVGVAEIEDPEGLVQMGEAVDPEALARAHGKPMR